LITQNGYLSTTFRSDNGREDLNFLVYMPAGRVYLWVQDSETYSSRRGWYAITSDSGFM